MGMWFGTEVITHHDHDVGEYRYDSCIVVHLSEITHEVIFDSIFRENTDLDKVD